ncbi:MAG: hypothetical protein AB2A00_41185 [Myxococcota bacterium]
MKRVLASALCVFLLSGFSCENGQLRQLISDWNTTLNFSFNGVDDDETPSCIETEEEIDLGEYTDLKAQAGEFATLRIIEVLMTVKNITATNTATHLSGSCKFDIGDGTPPQDLPRDVDLGDYEVDVAEGASLPPRNFDGNKVTEWLDGALAAGNGKVKFMMVACMNSGAVAGFDIQVDIKGEAEAHTPQ